MISTSVPGPIRAAAVAGAVILSAACAERAADSEAPEPASVEATADVRELRLAPALGIDTNALVHAGDGVWYQDVRQGSGRSAQAGAEVSVEYRAWLPDGTLFEQRPSPEGFGLSVFVPEENAPVPGLGVGMSGMRVGGVRRIIVPPDQSYGLVGRPAGVPAQSPVIFEVRLVGVN